ncbi:MAG TPA: response regulator [Telluria sp.]|nr:response regulator [Telluria sp.]
MANRVKVLVVDDDVVSRMVLMHLVDTSGSFDIVEAEDGEDAWRQLDGGLSPAITFCDLRMPRLSGMDLLSRVKADARLSGMPFVLVSAANDQDTLDQATHLGAHGFIVKPFAPEQVREQLAGLSASAAQGDEAPAQTVRRLGIDATRLLLYLGGLHKQLVAASAEMEQLIASGDHDGARQRMVRLREGCQTLGLLSAAAAFTELEAQPRTLNPFLVEKVLGEARQAALRQSENVRAIASTN